MKKLILLVILGISINCFSQFSKTHYIPPISNSSLVEPQDHFLYISSPSLTPINVRIIAIGGATTNVTVSRDVPIAFSIGFGTDTQMIVSSFSVSSIMNNKGYIIEAEDQVYAAVRVVATQGRFHAGGLVSKGLAALGTQFRIGAFINTGVTNTSDSHYTFASILATENNTTVSFNDIKAGVTLINNVAAGNTPANIILNRGESYTIATSGTTIANRDGLIGASITSSKPIAVNCGSFAGSNGDAPNLDVGFDQIVSAERTGTEYVFIRGNGLDVVERPLIIADQDNTEVFLNGSTTSFITLNAGQYVALNGSQFSANGNLYVRTSKNVFAYQGIGGSGSQANQNMHFVPPLACETPKIINNIPFINQVGNDGTFTGTVCIVTETGASLDFIINGTSYNSATLPFTINGPSSVTGNPGFVTYTIEGLQGNISVFSSKQVYLSYFGSSGFATYGGFYSGFTFKPEIAFGKLVTTTDNCIPNAKLAINSLSSFDTFQWFLNNNPITGATTNEYTPLQPGFYSVEAKISQCGTSLLSDQIPVSSCTTDGDNDGANDNIDIDNDNDGITNCTESFGNSNINLSNPNAGVINVNTYSNSFTGSTTGNGPQPTTPFLGNTDGSFVSETIGGLNNAVTQNFNFTTPVSLSLEYVMTANNADLLTTNGEFIIQVPIDKTITVLNPNDQLLIDTNYDGIYENGVTAFSSFQIRFRLNSSGASLAAGTGTFKFQTNLVNSFSYTHKNLSLANNRATFKLIASCVPKDTDNDGVADQLDLDSENDGIPDNVEALGQNFAVIPFVDANKNGLNDVHEPGLGTLDSDNDGIVDYLDIDSDNDGIYDLVESGSNALDANFNGIIDGNPSDFGSNGYANLQETATDSGILNFTITNTDTDNLQNYIDLDSDQDNCYDVIEAGFSDPNTDGLLGNTPLLVDTNGKVASGTNGYTTPNNNYITSAPIIIVNQPVNQTTCETQNATFTIQTNAIDSYQWQLSTDGINYTNIVNNALYSSSTTATLQITGATISMNNYYYRVVLNKNGNTCGLISTAGILTVLVRPVVVATTTLVQCDDDLDSLSDFNLTQKESQISANFASETFTYYSSFAAANIADSTLQITNPTVYNNTNGNTVWVRTQNNNQCYNITQMNLIVSATQIPAGTSWSFSKCDDFLDISGNNNSNNNDKDGIASFDFSSVTTDISAILPATPSYTIKYYKNEPDAFAETDASGNSLEITNINNYRNIGYANQQFIWVRVDSTVENACFGIGPYINLTVEALPIANPVVVPRGCDDDPSDAIVNHNFDTSTIESTLLNGQTNVTVTYTDQNNNALPSPLPDPFLTATQTISVRVTNNNTNATDGPCYDETTIAFVVDAQPIANPVTFAAACDANPDDLLVNFSFDTSAVQGTILGTQTFTVKYFAEDGTSLSSPLPNPFVTATQLVRVVIENPINNNCFAETFIQFTVNPLPDIELTNDEIICTGILNETVVLNAGLQSGITTDFSYEWFRNNQLIVGETQYQLSVNLDGVYTTIITNIASGCKRVRTNTVVYSQIASFENVTINDLTTNNTVNIVASGLGDYQFSIDNPNGPFQDTGLFENVEPGIHIVYINDKKGCGIVERTVAVIGAPPFFTPNGDGYNDFWKLKGINATFFNDAKFYIFDRYGKLLVTIPTGSDRGWDGTFNGQPLPADDYWFTLYLQDGRIAKGHFSLNR